MTKGPQEIRKQNITRMHNAMKNQKDWITYTKFSNRFMYGTGASKYKTKEYYDIIMNLNNGTFETRYDMFKELEFRYKIDERDITWVKAEKEMLEEDLQKINDQIKNLEETKKSQEQKVSSA